MAIPLHTNLNVETLGKAVRLLEPQASAIVMAPPGNANDPRAYLAVDVHGAHKYVSFGGTLDEAFQTLRDKLIAESRERAEVSKVALSLLLES